MSTRTTLLLCLGILLVAGGVLALIFTTEPEATRGGATKETAMLVEVVRAERGTYRPRIEAMGTVEPEREVMLSPRVSGEIVERGRGFVPGGVVDRGDLLLRIDPADYQTAVAEAKSRLRQAEADLELEMGRQDIARRDYELLGESVPLENQDLVLRRPQLETARAEVEAAKAAVERAELDLRRTTIRAPFDAHVLSRDANVGTQVAPGDSLGRLVGLETYWIEVSVPLSKLRFLTIPDEPEESGSVVNIRDRAAWAPGVSRRGWIDQLLGELADQTRMARLLVTVPDPLARRSDEPPLMIGSYVEAHIEGDPLADVVRISRDHLRSGDTVWVMDGGALSIRDVEIVMRDAEHAYLADGVEAGEQVVTTNLATVVDGAKLRLEGEATDPSSDQPADPPSGDSAG